MPCRSDGMEPNAQEQTNQRAARLLVYTLKRLDRPTENWMVQEANNIYARDERTIPRLCDVLKEMPSDQRDALVYGSPRDKMARQLADWWEEHQEADAIRETREADEARKKALRKSASQKLTADERQALGI
jgi:hypothetical protein